MIALYTPICLVSDLSQRIQNLFASCLVLSFCGLSVFSCQDDINIEPGPSLLDNYYSLEQGEIRTYSNDSITYDYDGDLQRIVIDTVHYYTQEHVLDEVEINGETWFRIGQFRSTSREGDYRLIDYLYEQKTPNRILRREGNLTFIPLASPLTLFEEWDGTAYFDASSATRFVRGEVLKPYDEWNYVYLDKWDEYKVQDEIYHDVLQINQRDTISIPSANDSKLIPPEKQLFYYLANEYYAPQTGLIEKEEYHLTSICASSSATEFETFCDTTTIFENAERGYIYHKKLISIE